MKTPTMDEAILTIIEWPDQDDFVCWNVQYSMNDGDPTDNSVELAMYWSTCRKMITISHV